MTKFTVENDCFRIYYNDVDWFVVKHKMVLQENIIAEKIWYFFFSIKSQVIEYVFMNKYNNSSVSLNTLHSQLPQKMVSMQIYLRQVDSLE